MTKIEIDLRDLGLPTYQDVDGEPGGASTLQDLIIEAATEKLLGSDRDLKHELRNKVTKKFNEAIDERVKVMVEEALSGPLQRTTSWGEPQGEPTTVRELIRESIEKFLKASGGRRDGYSNREPQNLSDLVDEAVKTAMTTDLKKTVDEAKKLVHKNVTDAALKAAVDILNK